MTAARWYLQGDVHLLSTLVVSALVAAPFRRDPRGPPAIISRRGSYGSGRKPRRMSRAFLRYPWRGDLALRTIRALSTIWFARKCELGLKLGFARSILQDQARCLMACASKRYAQGKGCDGDRYEGMAAQLSSGHATIKGLCGRPHFNVRYSLRQRTRQRSRASLAVQGAHQPRQFSRHRR